MEHYIRRADLKLLAQEEKHRESSLVLAPTCDIQRVSQLFCYLALLYQNRSESALKGEILCLPT